MTSLKRLVPAPALDAYHRAMARLAGIRYGHPSERMAVVGITGTNGKTTASWLTAKALEAAGDATGCTTTALFKVGREEWTNDRKMTMLGRGEVQALLRRMVAADCRYAVVETSSQGIVQHRHEAIAYDVAVLTNLTPEHIEAHGGFENYKQAKIELFRHLARLPRKRIGGRELPHLAVLNRTSPHARDFAVAGLDGIVWYGIGKPEDGADGVWAEDLKAEGWGMSFSVDGQRYRINLPGEVNVENALVAIAVAVRAFGMDPAKVADRLAAVPGMPGRFERILEGQPYEVLVDYAAEPAAWQKLYDVVAAHKTGRIIHVFGSCGGGRDRARRPVLGRMAAAHADIAIVTNEDPYDDDPMEIIGEIAAGAREAKMPEDRLRIVPDRREAVFAAMREAKPGDVVLLTGKGSEQAIMGPSGSRTPWDERTVAREAIRAAKAASG
jgi:UDP-N-acetylmuramoyl-L-alanyl-D-glutamate--2,6-diaminopimelate ligase